MKLDCKKLILKRPLKSKKIYSNINYQVKGSTTKFDIYI
jgi:16S rRNA (guanine1516-N2)-methyltransferase